MDLSVTFIGTAASVPSAARGVSATILTRGGDRVLIDCGEGTQRQLLRSGLGLVDLDLILLTHLHGDHYLGLPGMMKTYALRGRTRPVRIVAPRGLFRLFDELRTVIGRLAFAVDLDEHEPGNVWSTEGARIEAFATRHSVPSLGYALIEDARPGMFDLDAAKALGVPSGPLFGRLQRGETIDVEGRTVTPDDVLGPARQGRRIVVTGDTEPCEATTEISHRADLLVHEATFLDSERARARETRHSTAAEAALVARDAEVGVLALTHLSGRVMPREARAEAEAVFPAVVVPRDFESVEIPFAERGVPILHPRPGRQIEGATSGEGGSVSGGSHL